MMRIIIYTGKGGVGKTSVAAATGVKLARAGQRTLVISTDLAHSLADSFEIPLGHTPTPVMENLWAEEINPQSELEVRWSSIYRYMVDFLKVMGIKDILAEELTMLPGMEELFSLLEVYNYYQTGEYDVLILDCPPTASTLRILSFFDAMGWYMERFFKFKRKGIKWIRNFSDTLMSIPLPEDDVFGALEEMYTKMEVTQAILADPDVTSIRLVLNPEQMVINETQRAYTYMNLYGFNVDAAIVNKILPDQVDGAFYARWQKRQMENLQIIRDTFASMDVYTLPLLDDELHGLASLQVIADQLYGGRDPLEIFHRAAPLELTKEDGGYHFEVYMPFLEKKKFDLFQKGIFIIVTVAGYKRKILLPQVLSNKAVKKAQYRDQYLHLFF